MKKALDQSPLFRVLLPFVVGCVGAITLLSGHAQLFGALLLCLVALGMLCYRYFYNRSAANKSKLPGLARYQFRWLGGFVVFLLTVASALVNVWLHTADLRQGFFADSPLPQDHILLQLTAPLQPKGTYLRTTAKVIAIGSGSAMHNAEGNILLYFQLDRGSRYPVYGDQVLIKNTIAALKSPQNTGEFDFATYMAYQGIYHSAYLKNGDWATTGKNKGNLFWKSVYALKGQLKAELTEALPDSNERGIAEALVIGDVSDIPGETRTDYAGTGTVHILSVSGLHVGIVLFGLSWLFSFLTRIPYGKYARIVLILIIIWAYAFLTGFAAPVARSVIMFSIVFIGTNLGRRANIYNSISASALILLLMDPFLVMQASFQLSFIALTGIVWLQPKIAAWWKPKHKIVKYAWNLAAASMAAQLVTLPISVLYFNQMSLYFLPANLIVIPASFVVLIAGIVFVFVRMAPILWLHHLFSTILFGSIYGLNAIVAFINHLPGATWQGLYVNVFGALLLYLCIVLLLFGIIYKKKKLLASGLAFGICFVLARDIDIYNSINRPELGIMAVSPNHTIMTLKNRNRLIVIADSSFLNDKTLMKYHVNGYAWENYIRPGNIVCLNTEKKHNFSEANLVMNETFVGFYGKSILMINQNTHINKLMHIPRGMAIDAIVLCNDPRIKLADLYKKFRFKTVIAASGDNITNIREWETECMGNAIPFVNLQQENYVNVPI